MYWGICLPQRKFETWLLKLLQLCWNRKSRLQLFASNVEVNSFITNLEEVIGVSSVHVLAEPLDII